MSNLTAYRSKTDAQLQYIAKDAAEAAQAMRNHDPRAEAKYLDQVNDACTVLHERRKEIKRVFRKTSIANFNR